MDIYDEKDEGGKKKIPIPIVICSPYENPYLDLCYYDYFDKEEGTRVTKMIPSYDEEEEGPYKKILEKTRRVLYDDRDMKFHSTSFVAALTYHVKGIISKLSKLGIILKFYASGDYFGYKFELTVIEKGVIVSSSAIGMNYVQYGTRFYVPLFHFLSYDKRLDKRDTIEELKDGTNFFPFYGPDDLNTKKYLKGFFYSTERLRDEETIVKQFIIDIINLLSFLKAKTSSIMNMETLFNIDDDMSKINISHSSKKIVHDKCNGVVI